MHPLSIIAELDTILDALAMVSSLLMILFLMRNRRQYGCMLLGEKRFKKSERFTDEISLQMISQQSQKAYDNIQRSLNQEFDALRRLGVDSLPATVANQTIAADDGPLHSISGVPREGRNRRYRMADKMIAEGAGVNQIMQRCGLAQGELELLQGLRQLEQGARNYYCGN